VTGRSSAFRYDAGHTMPIDGDQPTLVYGRDGSGGAHPPPARQTFAEEEIVAARYRIVRFIAAGGMGEIYEAEDLELNERIAIKTVRAEMASAEGLERLRRELQLARKVTHPNVCRIFDISHHRAGAGAPVTFVTMELLRGKTLGQLLQARKQLPPEDALPIVRQIAEGLAAAHHAGVIHRDLKPDNILLTGEGASLRVVITDFGPAQLRGREQNAGITTPGTIIGTAAYLAPEQFEGGEASPATDIYALGVVMFELLTGTRPYSGDSLLTVMTQKLTEPPASPRVFVASLDARWESVILRCLERKPADRFTSALEVVESIATGTTTRGRRQQRGVLIAAAVLMLIAITGGVLQFRASRSELRGPQPQPTFHIVPRTSVAVLGFRNTAGRERAAWLSTALAEMLTTELAAEGRLRAISGEEVQRARIELGLRDDETITPELLARVRQNLGTERLVFGSYVALGEESGGQIRIDVRVQKNGEQAAAISETGTEANLFELVSKVGARVRSELGVAPAAPAVATMPADPSVARLYVEGLDELRNFDALAARTKLERAIEADPDHPMLHAALAQTWTALGYDRRAREEAKRAFDLSAKLPREQRLMIEAGYRETVGEWPRAADIYRALTSFFPDNLDYGLRLANALTKSGDPTGAATVTGYLRRIPPPLGTDPRIDLAEVDAAGALADYKRMQAAAERAIIKGEERGAPLIVARARSAEGVALHRQGRTADGIRSQEQALAIYCATGDRSGVARALVRIGSVYVYTGEIPKARPYFEDALKIADANGDKWVQTAGWNNLSFVSFMAGDPDAADAPLAKMLALSRELAEPKLEATAHDNIGFAYLLRADLDAAQESFTKSFELARGIGSQQVMAVAKANLGDVELARANIDAARRAYEEALAMRERIGEKRGIAESRIALANVAVEDGRAGDAERFARLAIEWAMASKVWDVEALGRTALARALVARRKPGDARREVDAAARLATQNSNVLVSITAGTARARVAAAEGKREEARRLAEDTVAEASRDSLVLPRLEAELARAEVAGDERRAPLLRAVARSAHEHGLELIERKATAAMPPLH
jgi:tetratricopeptide (TPR) repeat protein/tRNA A-37 threonylcarbamoyl transferase component Bud32